MSERAVRNRLDHIRNSKYADDLCKPAERITGTSTLYDKDGNVQLTWVKKQVDSQLTRESIILAVEELSTKISKPKPLQAPQNTLEHSCTVYTLTDCHVGMKAWGLETGADWDLDIAERTLTGATDYLIKASPKSHTCIINQLGDFLHNDSIQPVTPTSGHILDVDSRYSKVVKTATRILRNIIDSALKRHERVIVLMAEGNHDISSSVWLRHLFSLLYENEPRVSVIDSELPYYIHRHGKTLLAFHHGHLKKNDHLPLLFASQYPQEWGSTTKRYCHTGHRHHVEEKEHSGMVVIQHPTIAARDAYAARGGWIADRKMKAITYHADFGEVSTVTCVPEMLSA